MKERKIILIILQMFMYGMKRFTFKGQTKEPEKVCLSAMLIIFTSVNYGFQSFVA